MLEERNSYARIIARMCVQDATDNSMFRETVRRFGDLDAALGDA